MKLDVTNSPFKRSVIAVTIIKALLYNLMIYILVAQIIYIFRLFQDLKQTQKALLDLELGVLFLIN